MTDRTTDEEPQADILGLRGRVALVTGGSRGIGRSVSLRLARAGAAVAVNFRRSEAAAHETVAEIERSGGRAVAVQADVSRAEQVEQMIERVADALGPVAVLVNNAGVTNAHPLEALGETEWDATLRTNLTSAFLVTQAVLPGMRKAQWGRIVYLSSIAAQTGGVIGPHYAASKAGLIGLMHAYAAVLAKEGITANAIAPALIETDMIRGNPKIRPDLLPVGRFGTADEVADVVTAIAVNAYVTGQTINVNGGWYMS